MANLTFDEIPEILAHLVDKSLVQVDEFGRFTMLQLVRQFSQEEAVREADGKTTRNKHLAYYVELMDAWRKNASNLPQAKHIQMMVDEYENVRLAGEWALTSGAWQQAAQMSIKAFSFWFVRSMYEDAVRSMRAVIAAAPANDGKDLAILKALLAVIVELQASLDAIEVIEEAQRAADKEGDKSILTQCSFVRAMNCWRRGDLDAADSLMTQAEVWCDEISDNEFLPHVMINHANLWLFQNRFPEASSHYEKIRETWIATNNLRGVAVVEGNLSQLKEREADYKSAYVLARQALLRIAELGDERNVAAMVASACSGFWQAEDYTGAARLLGASQGVLNRNGVRFDELDSQTYQRWESRVQDKLDASVFDRFFAEGREMTTKDVIACLLANPEPWSLADAIEDVSEIDINE